MIVAAPWMMLAVVLGGAAVAVPGSIKDHGLFKSAYSQSVDRSAVAIDRQHNEAQMAVGG